MKLTKQEKQYIKKVREEAIANEWADVAALSDAEIAAAAECVPDAYNGGWCDAFVLAHDIADETITFMDGGWGADCCEQDAEETDDEEAKERLLARAKVLRADNRMFACFSDELGWGVAPVDPIEE